MCYCSVCFNIVRYINDLKEINGLFTINKYCPLVPFVALSLPDLISRSAET